MGTPPPIQSDAETSRDTTAPLDYSVPSNRRRHAFFSCLSLATTAVTFLWLGYIRSRFGPGPPHWANLDPLGVTLFNWYLLPGALSVALAVIGIAHRGRKRVLSYYAIGLNLAAYGFMMPPMNFA